LASSGTKVTAVAPLPITTMRFPVYETSSRQRWGCTTVPPKRSRPAISGVYPAS
jgi:hypothetical protein